MSSCRWRMSKGVDDVQHVPNRALTCMTCANPPYYDSPEPRCCRTALPHGMADARHMQTHPMTPHTSLPKLQTPQPRPTSTQHLPVSPSHHTTAQGPTHRTHPRTCRAPCVCCVSPRSGSGELLTLVPADPRTAKRVRCGGRAPSSAAAVAVAAASPPTLLNSFARTASCTGGAGARSIQPGWMVGAPSIPNVDARNENSHAKPHEQHRNQQQNPARDKAPTIRLRSTLPVYRPACTNERDWNANCQHA